MGCPQAVDNLECEQMCAGRGCLAWLVSAYYIKGSFHGEVDGG